MKKRIFSWAAILMMAALSLQAQTTGEPNPCDGDTQMDMNFCAVKRYKEADAELNKVYKALMADVSGDWEEQIRSAQRDWLKYRDSHCDCVADQYEGGSIRPMVLHNCLRRLTEQRTEELSRFMEDGGM